MKKYGLFYGSLRRNEYNFGACGAQKYLETMEISGFDLYSLGSYPAIVEGKGKVVAEIHEIDENTAKYIKGMELGAGYSEETMMHPKYGEVKFYVYRGKVKPDNKVDSGDWSQYLRSNGR